MAGRTGTISKTSRINMDALRELYRQTKLELQQERQANQGPQLGH